MAPRIERTFVRAYRGRYQGGSRDTNPAVGFRMKTFKVPDARYLGGLPHDTKPTRTRRNNARLFISDEGVGVGFFKPTQGKVGWNQMWGSSFDGSSDKAEMNVHLNDGTVVRYQVVGRSAAALRERLQGVMTEKGVRFLDDHR